MNADVLAERLCQPISFLLVCVNPPHLRIIFAASWSMIPRRLKMQILPTNAHCRAMPDREDTVATVYTL